jgi:hypothetical protein
LTQASVAQSRPPKHSAVVDLGVVVAFFLASSMLEPTLDPLLRRGHGLAGVLALAGYQFACEGLALGVILTVRHERPSSYGLTRHNLGPSLSLAALLALIYDLVLSSQAGALLWIPLRRHTATRMSLASGLPLSVVGLAVTVTVWGLV